MKVKVQYIVKDSEGKMQDGRIAWITRVPEGLAIGTIYAQQADAADLTDDELEYIKERGEILSYKVIEVL